MNLDFQAIHQLSSREKEAFNYFIHGMRVDVIAEKMIVTKNTIWTYKQRIMHKLQIKGRNEFKKACSHFLRTDK